MGLEAPDNSAFLRPCWGRFRIAPWILSLLVFTFLAAARFYAVLGPPQVRILFLLQVIVMWALPWIFLTARGRHEIGIARPRKPLTALALSGLAGCSAGLLFFALAWAAARAGFDNIIATIYDALQPDRTGATMPIAAGLAVIALGAVVLTPVGEEILFRGFLQQAFAMRWSVGTATLFNGLAFGLVHLHLNAISRDAAGFHFRPVIAFVIVLCLVPLSALLTVCRLRSGSLLASIAAHAACNFTAIGSVLLYYAL